MSGSNVNLTAFTDAAADRIARSVAAMQRDAAHERELREAQFAARMAELDARIAGVTELERRLTERLASVKDGEPGKDGRDGVDGIAGERGADGRDGVDGKDGADGVNGRDGVDGKDGDRGIEGPIGKLPSVTEWEDRVYYEGEVVTHDGGIFQAISDTGKAPGHEDWRCIVAAGANGRDGKVPRVRETWASDGEYRALDIVALNGASFIARFDEPGPCPGEGWQIMSMQGKTGKPGERGPKGDTGHVRAVTAMRADNDGLLTIVNADGSTVECDLYPVLSRLG